MRATTLIVTVLLGASAALSAHASGARAEAEQIKQAKLRPAQNSGASGRAVVEIYPKHAEIELDLRGVRKERGRVFLVWLTDAQKRTTVGGAFPNGFLSGEDGSVVVPAGEPKGERRARQARKMTITSMERDRALEFARDLNRDDWPGGLEIRGRVVLRGFFTPCPADGCWLL